MTTFSFHPVKPITTGEGGMIVTNSEELYRKLVLFRSHGITRDTSLMTRNEGPWYYQQLDLGYNYRMTDIQCALGCTQMKKLDRFLARRRAIAARYDEAFADCANIVTPYQIPEGNSGWHLYIIQVKIMTAGKYLKSCGKLESGSMSTTFRYISIRIIRSMVLQRYTARLQRRFTPTSSVFRCSRD